MSTRRLAALWALILVAPSWAAEPPRVDAFGDPLPDGAVRRLGTTRWRIGGYSRSAVLSPDGKTILAESGGNGTILRIDAATGKSLEPLIGGSRSNSDIYFMSRDGRTLVGCGYDGVWIWDTTGVKPLKRITLQRTGMESYSLADGGGYLAHSTRLPSANQPSGKVVVHDLAGEKIAATVETLQNESVQAVLTSDGKLLATWGRHYDRANPGGNPRPDNPNSIIQIWDVATAKEKSRVTTGGNYVGTARFAPDGQTLVTGGMGAMVQSWDVATGKALRQFPARSGQGLKLYFSPDGKQLAATGGDGSIQVWEAATGRRVGIAEGFGQQVMDVVFPPLGPAVALGRKNNAFVVWTVPDGKRLTPEGGHTLVPGTLQFAPDSKTLLSFDSEGRVLRWDTGTGKEVDAAPLRTAADYRYPRRPFSSNGEFSPSGRWLAVGIDSGGVRSLYDVKTGSELFAFAPGTLNNSREFRLTFSANEARAAMVSQTRARANVNAAECVAHVWEAESGLLIGTWPAPWLDQNYDSYSSCALTPDGQRLIVLGMSRAGNTQQASAGAIELATGKVLGRYNCPTGYQLFPAIAGADGRSALLPGPNGEAVVWDMLSGAVKQTLAPGKRLGNIAPKIAKNGRVAVLTAIEQRNDGNRSFVNSTIVVAEWVSGEPRFEFPLPEGITVAGLALSADGRTLAAGCSDTTILLYDLSPTSGARPWDKNPTPPAELWLKLTARFAPEAWEALRELTARPDVAMTLVRARLKPAAPKPKPDPADVQKWLTRLEAKAFTEREEAERRLISHGEFVAKDVSAALEKATSQEAKRRLERITGALNKPVAISVPDARALELLESLGTKEALEHVRTLAAGDPAFALTRDAQLTLERLTRSGSRK